MTNRDRKIFFGIILLACAVPFASAAPDLLQNAASLPRMQAESVIGRTNDWLIDSTGTDATVVRGDKDNMLVLQNGLIRRTFRLGSTAATVGFDNLMTGASMLRALDAEARLTIDGKEHDIGKLGGQRDRGYLLPEWIDQATNASPDFEFRGFQITPVQTPLKWKAKRHHADFPWPPKGAAVDLCFGGAAPETKGLNVTIHYEIYDGVPVLGKWITLSNASPQSVTLNHFVQEQLSFVEAESAVDDRTNIAWRVPAVNVFSDYMFHGMDFITGNQIASWRPDREYKSQVSFLLDTPCVLVVEPKIGPDAIVPPGGSFTTFRSYLIVQDSTDRERQGLTIRHAQRVLAPWTTENPVMMHVRNADRKTFRNAVDQCAAVGFEMIIYTFGSGLNMENENPEYLARVKEDVDYAHSKGIEVGGYSLFSSRSINPQNDVINPKTGKPGGAIFGSAPCFASQWGINYFSKLTNFISATGLDLLEHDGPYPGDICASTNHPGHHGEADSQWANWKMNAGLYAWCRERGVYVNQPDYYFLAGGSKTGMGYREDNWSLPRAQQLIHARQHIYDGTWSKPQTSGWMMVPLTQYHGGGAAATIEPLHEHLDAYEGQLVLNLGDGVQACWRGPRLYDTDETKDLVKKWVDFFKKHRDILESDIVHGRRADGRDIDYLVHINPHLKERAFAMIHNPLDTEIERTIPLPLYYTGLRGNALIQEQDGAPREYPLDSKSRALVTIKIPAHSQTWLVAEAPDGR